MAAVFQTRFTPLRPTAAPRRAGALAAVAMHLVAVAALLSYEPVRSALFAAAPIMVELVAPPRPEPEKPTELPKPKPVAKVSPRPPIAPAPILTVPTEAPSPVAVVPQPPAPPAPVPIDAPPATPVPAKAEPATTQPIFNADYLDNPAPLYPSASRRMNEQGRVILRVFVSSAGRAEEVQVRNTSGSLRLDDAARDAVRRWKFVPAKRGADPVSAWVLIPISFKLEG